MLASLFDNVNLDLYAKKDHSDVLIERSSARLKSGRMEESTADRGSYVRRIHISRERRFRSGVALTMHKTHTWLWLVEVIRDLHRMSRRELATREIMLTIPPYIKGTPPPSRVKGWRAWTELTLEWDKMLKDMRMLFVSAVKLVTKR
jgi:hypothetical protein